MRILASLLAGLGLFFVGASLVGDNLKKAASRRMRLFFAGVAGNTPKASLVGAAAGFVTQSTSVAAFIVAGLVSGGLVAIGQALPMVLWSNAGCSLLVFIAVLDIQQFVLFCLFLTGMGFAFERPVRYKHVVKALFGICLLFFGLQMVRAAASPLSDQPWVRDIIFATKGSTMLAMLAGALLTVVTQTAIGIILIAIAMIQSNLFTINQTIMLIYGAHLGSGALTWFFSRAVKGEARQLIMSQVLLNVIGTVLLSILFYVEIYGHIPLMKAAAATLGDSLESQMVWIVVLFNFGMPLVLTIFIRPFSRLLSTYWPRTEEEELGKVRFIHEHATQEPDTALVLADRELARLMARMPLYTDSMRAALECKEPTHAPLHAAFGDISQELRAMLEELAGEELAGQSSHLLVNLQNRLEQAGVLEQTVNSLADLGPKCPEEGETRRFAMMILEALDFLLLTASDAANESDREEARTLHALTAGREGAVEKVRNRFLELSAGMSMAERQAIYAMAGLFERSVWTLNRLAALLAENPELDTDRPAKQ